MKLSRFYSPEAERSILTACMLLGGEAVARAELADEAFFDPKHRVVWQAINRLAVENKQPDPVLVLDELERIGKVGIVGGIGFLSDLMAETPTGTNVEHYAAIVRDLHLQREVRVAIGDLISDASKNERNGAAMLESLYEIASRLAKQVGGDVGKSIGDWTKLALSRLEKLAQTDGGATFGISTGLEDLDEILGGLMPGNVTILGGRPSMGKSALARTIADGINARGIGVHVFSVEDSGESYALRALADHGRLDLARLMKGQVQRGDMEPLQRATGELFERRAWWVDDVTGVSAEQIALRVRRLKRELGTQLVVVDYLQLLVEPKARDKMEEVSRAAESLARLARSEGVAVLALSQLSRDCERRPDKRPIAADLRETGVLEQIAYAICFCYRDEVYDPRSPDAGVAEVLVRKNKNGRTGTVKLRWDGPSTAFRPLSWKQTFRNIRPELDDEH
jgi:replicative DNA helicase